jgi:hypothetical protein
MRILQVILNVARWTSDLRTLRAPVVSVGLCRKHHLINIALTVLAIGALPLGAAIAFFAEDFQVQLWSAVAGFMITAIAFSRPRPVKAVHLDNQQITLAGIGVPFLASLVAGNQAAGELPERNAPSA